MEKIIRDHDRHIFSTMVRMLVYSGCGEKDYGFNQKCKETTLREVADVLNTHNYTNRAGQPLNRNTLKQIVHRVKRKERFFEEQRPDWSCFAIPGWQDLDSESQDMKSCLLCGEEVKNTEKELCSPTCENQYRVIRYGQYVSGKMN